MQTTTTAPERTTQNVPIRDIQNVAECHIQNRAGDDISSSEVDYAETESSRTISKARQDIALEALWEIEASMNILVETLDGDPNGRHLFYRSVFNRTRQAACIAMSAISDEHDTVERMRNRLERGGR